MPVGRLSGALDKMAVALRGGAAHYQLPIGGERVDMNALIGKKISLDFANVIRCKNCGAATKKSYSQGFCYPCSQSLAACDLCIMRPETCHFHLGTCREPDWGERHCFVPHVVYLANSSNAKVGISRKNNIPGRWIDQGAVSALPIIEVDSRVKSGKLEVALKRFLSDKTDWRKMLRNELSEENLENLKRRLIPEILQNIDLLSGEVADEPMIEIRYPVVEYPQKIVSLSLLKTPHIEGTLLGIKGQYLILDIGVLNVRKFSAHQVVLTMF